jgi:hypothetical protein
MKKQAAFCLKVGASATSNNGKTSGPGLAGNYERTRDS